MTLAFYSDVNFPGPVVKGLRQRNIDVVTATEDDREHLTDEELLSRAAELGRVFLTQDKDFFQIVKGWQTQAREFPGVLFAHHGYLPYRELIDEVEIVANVGEHADLANRIEVLPLRST